MPVDRLVLVLAGAAVVDVDVLVGRLAGRHDRPVARAAPGDQGVLELALLLERPAEDLAVGAAVDAFRGPVELVVAISSAQ